MDELIRKKDAIDALMAERKHLLDKGQKGAEHILTHHGYNVIDELPPVQSDVPDTNVGDMIYRQAAIDALYHVDEYNARSIEAIKNLPSAQPEQRWIPCSERLPEQYGNYLVSYRTDDFESDIGTFDPDRINSDTGEWSACDANGFYWVASKGLEVIAWMPLPEPYREDIE